MESNLPDEFSPKERFFFDGSPSNWIKLFNAKRILGLGGVLLFLGGERELDRAAAGWQLVVTFIATETGERFFSSVEQIIPENIGDRDILNNLKQFLEKDLKNTPFQDEEINSFFEKFNVIRLSSLEGKDVITKLEGFQDGAAVAISCADLYRFPEINGEHFAVSQSWVGIEFGLRTREQIYFSHLMELTRQILKVAKEKNLFVTLFCEVYEFIQYKYPSDLLNDPELSIFVSPLPNRYYHVIRTFQKSLIEIDTQDIDTILGDVANTIDDEKNRALITSFLLSTKQNHNAAWDAIEPYLDEFQDSSTGEILLSLSQTAISAGKIEKSKSLLINSVNRGIYTLEDIHSAYKLAKVLELDPLSSQLLENIQKNYPNNTLVLWDTYVELYESRQFSKAAEVASKLGDPFLVKLCETLGDRRSDLNSFFDYAKQKNKLDYAYLAAAHEAEYQKEYRFAREFASMVETDSPHISQAIQIRIRVLSKILRDHDAVLENETAELMGVIRIASALPQDADLRFELEELLESGLEEPTIIVILSYILLRRIHISFQEIQNNNYSFGKYDVKFDSNEGDIADATFFFEQYFKSLPASKEFVLGQGEIPNHLSNLITPDLVRALILILQQASSEITRDDFQFLYQLLHIIILVCQVIGDPSSDFIATRIVISRLALAGYAQQARDLAETALILFPRIQTEYFEWRIGQAWACYAEAHHRTHNILAALRYLCFSILCWNGPALNRDLLCSFYRLSSRVFRDLGLADFGLETVNLERIVNIKTNAAKKFIQELEQVELSIQLTKLDRETSSEILLEHLGRLTELLNKSEEKELGPLLSLQAHLIMLLKLNEVEIPNGIEENLKEQIGLLDEAQREFLSSVINTQPKKEDILRAIQIISPANDLSDLAYQITQTTNLIKNSVKTAYQKDDIDLFILSSILLSQPILTLHSKPSKNDKLPSSEKIQSWWLQFLAKNSHDAKKIIEGLSVLQNVSPMEEKSIAELSEISIRDFQTIIEPDELVIIVARDVLGHMYRATISNDSYTGPDSIDIQVWSPTNYYEWRRHYPHAYGMWTPPSPLADEYPSKVMVNESLSSLSIGDFRVKQRVFIIPDAELFGYPFQISLVNNKNIGESSEVAIVPSVSWMFNARTSPRQIYSGKRAWMGSSTSMDLTIHFLRDRLTPVLQDAQIELIESDHPSHLENSELAFITSHGGVGLFDNFRAISDTTTSYSAKEFSRTLKGCGCVVLFVCNSGRSDRQVGSSETVGLVSELLRMDVKCVVAPPWPLHVNIAEIWLPPFLEYLSSGYSVGHSSYIASREVAKKYDNPCAWGILHVYGDASFKLAS
ncbi:MAG: hypothetical protein H6633_32425 [Anaerolineales bacterium]|nr:hypothetical protein [Anaerolineales bacterium]